jgi:putative DNA primase/helicase
MDLRTGQVRKATNAEQITMSLPCSPAATYEGSAWIDWLQKVMPDPTERTLLQNLMGYTLCGHRDGKLFVVLCGTSGAGKSAFLEVMFRVMGEYGDAASTRYLYASDQGESSLDYAFAQLHGKRFAMADELVPGRTIAEDFIKSLSSGATVTIRKRHGHEQTAVATACLWMGTNDLPRVRGGGEPMVVRCRLFAWHHVLNQHDIRKHLYADLPAALAWVLEGAQRYLTEGPPCLEQTPAMLDAATEWLTEEAYSPMRRFVKDCIGHEAEAWTSTADMEEAYYEWCKRQRDRIDAKWNATGLASALDGHGFRKTGPTARYPCPAEPDRKRDSSGKLARGWLNLVLREPTARPVQPLTSGKPAAWNPDWMPSGLPV